MTDLRERFRELDRIATPDLDNELRRARIEERPGTQLKRFVTAGLAILIALVGFAFTIQAFRKESVPAATPNPVATKTNGVLVFSVSRQGTYQINPDGTGERQLFPPEPVHHSQIAWSPDGARIAYVNYLVDHYGIYVSGADGGEVRQLTDGVNDGWPTWSPDGTRIAFASSRADSSVDGCIAGGDALCPTDLYVMNADGTGVSRLTDDPAPEYAAAWSPDGTRIAFVKVVDERTDIFLMNADGSGMRRLTNDPGWTDRPIWSPDGSQIAFWGAGQRGTAIYVMDAGGTNRRLILDGVSDTSIGLGWSPDGAYIAFTSNVLDVPVWALYLMRPDGSEIRRLSSDGLSVGEDIAWQPIVGTSASPASSESLPPEGASLNPHVTDTIPVGAFPRAVAVGEGAVWATVDNANGGPVDHLLVKIDPATNEIMGSVQLPEAGDLAVGEGAVWVLSRLAADAAVLRIDPLTDQVEATIPVGLNPSNVVVSEGAVWVTVTTTTSTLRPSGEVIRIDPATNEVVARIPVSDGWPRDVVVGEGSVWVYGHSGYSPEHGWEVSSLWRIDPLTNELAATVLDQAGFLGDGSYLPDNVAAGDGWVWAASDRGKGLRIDPTTGTFTVFELAEGGFAWPFLAYEGHIIFGLGTVRVLDMGTLEVVGSIALDSQVADAALDAETGTLWIANYEGSVTRIDLH